MPFTAGRPRPINSGRRRGKTNRKNEEVAARLASLNCDPIEGMVRIAQDPSSSPELRGKMFSELAQYVHAKRKALEHSAEDGGSLEIIVTKVGNRRSEFQDGFTTLNGFKNGGQRRHGEGVEGARGQKGSGWGQIWGHAQI